MADSETSTTLSAVSRRRMISTTFAASTAPFLPSAATPQATANTAPDPTIRAWREWQSAHRKTLALCRKQQCLESKLQRAIGFPYVCVRVDGMREPVRITSLPALDEVIETYPAAATLGDELMSKLSAHQKRWEEADRRLGYSVALQQEELAAKQEQQLAEALWATPSSSLDGIVAKLESLIAMGQWKEDCEELPWPQIRSALADLRRLSRNGADRNKSKAAEREL